MLERIRKKELILLNIMSQGYNFVGISSAYHPNPKCLYVLIFDELVMRVFMLLLGTIEYLYSRHPFNIKILCTNETDA